MWGRNDEKASWGQIFLSKALSSISMLLSPCVLSRSMFILPLSITSWSFPFIFEIKSILPSPTRHPLIWPLPHMPGFSSYPQDGQHSGITSSEHPAASVLRSFAQPGLEDAGKGRHIWGRLSLDPPHPDLGSFFVISSQGPFLPHTLITVSFPPWVRSRGVSVGLAGI